MNTNKNTIIIALIVLALIVGTGYKAVFGQEDPIPTLDELRLQARNDLMDQQQRIDTHNLMALSACIEEAKDKAPKASEQIKFQNDCFEKNKRRDIDIEKEMERFTTSGTLATGSTVVPAKIDFSHLDVLHKKVCDKQINSPLCKDRDLFNRLYTITEDRIPGKNFFPILLGITNAESSLGLAYAKNNKGGFCNNYNNYGGVKWKKTDEGKSIRDQSIPQSDGCWLYKFESVEDYWTSKTNTIRFGYKGCLNSKTPVKCLSFAYVGDRNVAEENWIRNVSIFLD